MAIALISTLIPIGSGLAAWLVKGLLKRLSSIETSITDLKGDHAQLDSRLDNVETSISDIKTDIRELRQLIIERIPRPSQTT